MHLVCTEHVNVWLDAAPPQSTLPRLALCGERVCTSRQPNSYVSCVWGHQNIKHSYSFFIRIKLSPTRYRMQRHGSIVDATQRDCTRKLHITYVKNRLGPVHPIRVCGHRAGYYPHNVDSTEHQERFEAAQTT